MIIVSFVIRLSSVLHFSRLFSTLSFLKLFLLQLLRLRCLKLRFYSLKLLLFNFFLLPLIFNNCSLLIYPILLSFYLSSDLLFFLYIVCSLLTRILVVFALDFTLVRSHQCNILYSK